MKRQQSVHLIIPRECVSLASKLYACREFALRFHIRGIKSRPYDITLIIGDDIERTLAEFDDDDGDVRSGRR